MNEEPPNDGCDGVPCGMNEDPPNEEPANVDWGNMKLFGVELQSFHVFICAVCPDPVWNEEPPNDGCGGVPCGMDESHSWLVWNREVSICAVCPDPEACAPAYTGEGLPPQGP